MNWQALCDGLAAWFSRLSEIPLERISWDGEPIGDREYPYASLRLTRHESVDAADEIRDVVAGDVLGAEAVGNRRRTLACRVTTRDQRPDGRAYVVLERVRDRLWLPWSQEALCEFGIGLQDALAVIDLGVDRTLRQESEAVLELVLNFASSETDTVYDRGFIEHVQTEGTVRSGSTTITVPDRTTPPVTP